MKTGIMSQLQWEMCIRTAYVALQLLVLKTVSGLFVKRSPALVRPCVVRIRWTSSSGTSLPEDFVFLGKTSGRITSPHLH